MGLTLKRFGFDGEPPSLRSVYERVCAREDRPVRFVDRQHGVASLLAQRKYDSVGLVRTDRTIEIHGMLGAGLVAPVSHALREMGGEHPLPQADPLNPDYGETWMGTLAEGDDVDIFAGDCRFRIWVPYLSDALANEVAELEDELRLTLHDFRTHVAKPVDGQRALPEAAEVNLELLEFLSAAAGRGITHVVLRPAASG